jgi:hypothetical protein
MNSQPPIEPSDCYDALEDLETFAVLTFDFNSRSVSVGAINETDFDGAQDIMNNENGNSDLQSWVIEIKEAKHLNHLISILLAKNHLSMHNKGKYFEVEHE